MNSDALAYLAGKGLSLEEIVELARIMERKKDPTNAERQARHRERKKSGKVTRYSNAVTPPIEYIHTPQSDISSDDESQTERVSDDCEAVIESWNAMASATGLPSCSKMQGKRRKACQARLRSDGLQAIQKAIERIPKSAFLRGEAGSWAGANIDFLLKPDSVTSILEGKYDDRNRSKPNGADRDEIQNPYVRAAIARQNRSAAAVGG